MDNNLVFSVIGGDNRQVALISLLLEKGHRVNILGFDEYIDNRVAHYKKIDAELFNCDVLLLPIPYKDKQGNININKSHIKINLKDIVDSLGNTRPWFVLGKADKDFKELIGSKKIEYLDLVQEESFSVLNAIPSAEGAIQKAMEMTNVTIHGSKVLVLGYGRIGKSLSRMLKGIGAHVLVEARSSEDLAWIAENGYEGVHLKDLGSRLPYQDIIFNTIPHLILDKDKLAKVNKDAVILDLASYPGGVDFYSATQFGIKASLELGLPGIVAPKTAAKIIYRVIMNSLPKDTMPI